jgi:hypothetical protein
VQEVEGTSSINMAREYKSHTHTAIRVVALTVEALFPLAAVAAGSS